jgi:hypothetical protein
MCDIYSRECSFRWRVDGPVFIDRSARKFEYVLDFYRDCQVHLSLDISREEVEAELRYYGLDFTPTSVVCPFAVLHDQGIKLKQAVKTEIERLSECAYNHYWKMIAQAVAADILEGVVSGRYVGTVEYLASHWSDNRVQSFAGLEFHSSDVTGNAFWRGMHAPCLPEVQGILKSYGFSLNVTYSDEATLQFTIGRCDL